MSMPVLVSRPILIKSRLLNPALTISSLFFLAFSRALCRVFEIFAMGDVSSLFRRVLFRARGQT
jgi:hypothetical protein